MTSRSNRGLTFAKVYLGLYVLSGIYAIGYLLFGKPAPEFNPPSIATLPWSIVIVIFAHSQGITDWYQRHAGDPILYGAVMTLILLPAALVNALILYWLGKLLDGSRRP